MTRRMNTLEDLQREYPKDRFLHIKNHHKLTDFGSYVDGNFIICVSNPIKGSSMMILNYYEMTDDVECHWFTHTMKDCIECTAKEKCVTFQKLNKVINDNIFINLKGVMLGEVFKHAAEVGKKAKADELRTKDLLMINKRLDTIQSSCRSCDE